MKQIKYIVCDAENCQNKIHFGSVAYESIYSSDKCFKYCSIECLGKEYSKEIVITHYVAKDCQCNIFTEKDRGLYPHS